MSTLFSGMGHSFEEAFASLLDCLRLYTEAKGETANADAGRDSIIATPIADFSYSVNPRERKDVVAV